jgi:hypothetical protein
MMVNMLEREALQQNDSNYIGVTCHDEKNGYIYINIYIQKYMHNSPLHGNSEIR